jgi:hypothetical protein
MYGERHPHILQFNGNFVSLFSIRLNHEADVSEEKKTEYKALIKENIDTN